MSKGKKARLSRIILASFVVVALTLMGTGCALVGPKTTVTGKVIARDGSNQEIPMYGAVVRIGKAGPASTGYDGTFEIAGVREGRQTLTIEKQGFKPLTKIVEIKAGDPDLGVIEITPKEGTETIEVVPEWTLLADSSATVAALENEMKSIEISPNTVIADVTVEVALEQDGGKSYVSGAKGSLIWTGTGIRAEADGTLIIMGIKPAENVGYTIRATGKAGSDLNIFEQQNIVIQGSARIEAEDFGDGKSYGVGISLHAFLESRPQ